MSLSTDLTSAYMAAQTKVDSKLGYSNPYALPITLKAITDHLEDDSTAQSVIDAVFSGRLRGSVIAEMKRRGYSVSR